MLWQPSLVQLAREASDCGTTMVPQEMPLQICEVVLCAHEAFLGGNRNVSQLAENLQKKKHPSVVHFSKARKFIVICRLKSIPKNMLLGRFLTASGRRKRTASPLVSKAALAVGQKGQPIVFSNPWNSESKPSPCSGLRWGWCR